MDGSFPLEDLVIAWRINNDQNLNLLDSIEEEYLNDRASTRGLTVGEQFVHMHNVRYLWIEVKAKKLLGSLSKVEKERAHDKQYLRENFVRSCVAFEGFFELYKNGLKAKGSHQSITTFFSYMIAHEAHHRGQIILHLKLSSHNLPSKLKFGLWDW